MSVLQRTMTRDEILARITDIFVQSFDLKPEQVKADAHLIDDLDLDSIDAIDFVVGLEAETGLDVSEDELKSIRLVQDIVELVHRKMTENERAGG